MLLWLPFIACFGLLAFNLYLLGGPIGHDYYLALTELMIGKAHFFTNGLDLPHYTARMCGGLPFLADPQSTYFSIHQWLVLFLPALFGVWLGNLLFVLIGYFGSVRLFSRGLQLSLISSHLGGLLVVLSGFFFEHLYVGHLTHHGFMLFPWLFYWLLTKPTESLANRLSPLILFSFALSYLFLSGGTHLIIVFAFTVLLLLPFLHHYYRNRPLGLVSFFAVAGLLTLGLCSGKLVGAVLFNNYAFDRPLSFSLDNPIRQLFRYFWFLPSATAPYLHFGALNMGAWEFIGFTSKLTIPLGAYGIWAFRKRPIVITIALALTAVVLLLATGRLNDGIPFMEHYHNPIKLMAAFLWPLWLLSIYSLERFFSFLKTKQLNKQTLQLIFFFLSAILFWEYSLYSNYFTERHLGANYYPRDLNQISALAQTKSLPPVSKITNIPGQDLSGMLRGESSLRCYEPLLGYRWEGVLAKLTPGETAMNLQDSFNLTHPGCLLYPKHFNCKPWDRIPWQQTEAFNHFRSGRTAWGIPYWHSLLFTSNGVLALLLLLFLGARRRK